jgi:hypothetical protein
LEHGWSVVKEKGIVAKRRKKRRNPDHDTRPTIIESAARALFAQAYADAVEQGMIEGEHPGPGGEWLDVVPPTPKEFKDSAKRLIEQIEKTAGMGIEGAYLAASTMHGTHYKEPSAEDFGWYLAMEALGHGVSWADDHPDPGLDLPYWEASILGQRDYWLTNPTATARRPRKKTKKKKDGFVKGVITVSAMDVYGESKPVRVDAMGSKGLAVHKGVDVYRDRPMEKVWRISHVGTGKGLGLDFPTQKVALQVAKRLLRKFPGLFVKGPEVIQRDPRFWDVSGYVREVRERLYAGKKPNPPPPKKGPSFKRYKKRSIPGVGVTTGHHAGGLYITKVPNWGPGWYVFHGSGMIITAQGLKNLETAKKFTKVLLKRFPGFFTRSRESMHNWELMEVGQEASRVAQLYSMY